MIKKYKKSLLAGSLVILLPVLAGLLLWNRLPEQIPTHWGVNGEVDGWSSKPFAVIGLPGIILALHWLCVLATNTDPKNKNQSNKPMAMVLWICPVLSLLLGAMVLGAALGWKPDVLLLMPMFMGILFVVIGNYMPKCTHNYTIGIKIPWTLNSEENWNATHRFAGRIWVVGGVLSALCGFLPGIWSVVGLLGITLVMIILPILYSWRFYKRENA